MLEHVNFDKNGNRMRATSHVSARVDGLSIPHRIRIAPRTTSDRSHTAHLGRVSRAPQTAHLSSLISARSYLHCSLDRIRSIARTAHLGRISRRTSNGAPISAPPHPHRSLAPHPINRVQRTSGASLTTHSPAHLSRSITSASRSRATLTNRPRSLDRVALLDELLVVLGKSTACAGVVGGPAGARSAPRR